MSRPRIRSIKPEAWQDEAVGALSRDARLLFVGLITMADDEGRLRAQPSMLLGSLFPWDDIAPRELLRWLDELTDSGIIIRYDNGGKPYVAFRNWRRHQRINRPSPSELPPPPFPEVVAANSSPDSVNEPDQTQQPPHDKGSQDFTPSYARGSDLDQEGIGTDGNTSAAVAAREDSPEVRGLCQLLADLIVANDPSAKPKPESAGWRDECRRLLERDERSVQEAEQVMRWCQADAFWRSNILSMPTFRRQYAQLRLKMNAPAGRSNAPSTADWLAAGRTAA